MQAMERIASESMLQWIFLHTSTDNTPARRLFEGQGYEVREVRGDFYPEGQDALLMCRELHSS